MKIFGGLLATALALWIASSFFKPRENERAYLLSLPRLVADLAEKKQAPEIKRYISKDYKDKQGRTYEHLNALILGHVLQGGEITIYTISPEVDLELEKKPPHAVLRFKAAMARGARNPGVLDVIPESASIYDFTIELDKTSEGWLVKSGDWQRSGLTD